MRRTLLLSLAVTTCVVSGAATAGDDDNHHDGRVYQTSNLFQFMTTTPVAGAATLYRTRNRLEMRVAASGLDPSAAYTVWWVVFNNPHACVGGCGGDDLSNPAVKASVFYAAGFVTGMDGTGNVSGYIESGALPEGIDIETGNGLRRGRGFRAEVHIVVRTHGAITPGSVDQQIGTFNGGCSPTCVNQQAAVFLPVA